MDEITQKLEELNGLLASAGQTFAIGFYDPHKLKLLETNARYMTNDKFAALVANVKRDKGLASVPLVYAFEEPETPLVLSGNHRVMAARAAATGALLCMVVTQEKTPDELIAIQLSHNSIAGADDLQTLKALYEKITAIDMKVYSGLDEDTIQKLAAIKFEPISEPRLVFKTVTLLFMPSERDAIKEMIGKVDKLLADNDAYVFEVSKFMEFWTLLAAGKEGLVIQDSSTTLLEIMRRGVAQVEAEVTARTPAPPPVAAVPETSGRENSAAAAPPETPNRENEDDNSAMAPPNVKKKKARTLDGPAHA
jgi:hypothetical protein